MIYGKVTVETAKEKDGQPEVRLRWTIDDFAKTISRGRFDWYSPKLANKDMGLVGEGTWHLHFQHIKHANNNMWMIYDAIEQDQLPANREANILYQCYITSENSAVKLEQYLGKRSCSKGRNYCGHAMNAPTAFWKAQTMVAELTLTIPDWSLLLQPQQPPVVKSLTDKMNVYYKSARLTDAVLISSDKREIKCHRMVLAAHSDVFEAMFEHDTKERRTGICEVKDVDHETLKVLVNVLYGNDGGDWSSIADKVFVAADKYQMLELKEKCAQLLHSTITVQNAVGKFVFAKQNNVVGLAEKVVEFVSANHDEFVKSGGMVEVMEKAKDFHQEFFGLLHKVGTTTSTGTKRSADVAGL